MQQKRIDWHSMTQAASMNRDQLNNKRISYPFRCKRHQTITTKVRYPAGQFCNHNTSSDSNLIIQLRKSQRWEEEQMTSSNNSQTHIRIHILIAWINLRVNWVVMWTGMHPIQAQHVAEPNWSSSSNRILSRRWRRNSHKAIKVWEACSKSRWQTKKSNSALSSRGETGTQEIWRAQMCLSKSLSNWPRPKWKRCQTFKSVQGMWKKSSSSKWMPMTTENRFIAQPTRATQIEYLNQLQWGSRQIRSRPTLLHFITTKPNWDRIKDRRHQAYSKRAPKANSSNLA